MADKNARRLVIEIAGETFLLKDEQDVTGALSLAGKLLAVSEKKSYGRPIRYAVKDDQPPVSITLITEGQIDYPEPEEPESRPEPVEVREKKAEAEEVVPL